MFNIRKLTPIVTIELLLCAVMGNADDFALKDGDTVVFLGDSITAARTYGEIIENYTLLRYPQRRICFVNAGRGGDTATGGAARLDPDVFDRGATVLTVAYGVNDIGWGVDADDEHKQDYLNAIRKIIQKCRERNVRVFICSAAITAEDPNKAADGFLQSMCDEGLAIAREMGAGAIDVPRAMRTIQQRVLKANENEASKTSMHAADGVHLNELGQLAMGFAILKGLGAPRDVSSATIDYSSPEVEKVTGCTIDNLQVEKDSLAFTRLDDGLPINFGLFGSLNFRFVPVHDELNRYMLMVRKLPEGVYELTVDGRGIGSYRHDQLARGVNISSATTDAWQPGGPWDAQATALKSLTEARSSLAVSQLTWDVHLQGSHGRPLIADPVSQLDARLRDLQRVVARPMAYRYRLTPTDTSTAKD